MTTEHVPQFDMLGLPLLPWPMQLLMSLALAVHWSFIGTSFAGAAIILRNTLRRRAALNVANRRLVPFVIFAISYGITWGIAPLLFVQVLYGSFFYSANVLIAWWWLGIVPLLILIMYLLYYVRQRSQADAKVNAAVPALATLGFAAVASILVSNTTLSQIPHVWQDFYWSGRGLMPYWGDIFLPRWIFALAGLLAMGGIMIGVLAKAALGDDPDVQRTTARTAFRLSLAAMGIQLGTAVALILALPAGQRSLLVSDRFTASLAAAAVIAFAAAAVMLLPATRKLTTARVAAPAVAYFIGLFALALVRDALRREAVSQYLDLSQVPVNAQWGPFALFAGIAGAGGIVVAYFLNLTVRHIRDVGEAP